MIIKNWAFVAAAFVLLQLTPLKCDAQKRHPQCEGEICHIYPDSIWQLQTIISPNRHIILNGVEFNINGSNGFTLIENVSNLTISSAEEEGSIINCSSESTFGLYLKNTTNISLTGITIMNCASCIPNHAMQYQHLSHIYNEATFLIMISRYVNLLKVDIEYSPGVALAIYDSILEEPSIALDNMSYNLTLTNSTITHSREGSIVIFGTSLLIERTLITNCSWGIENYKANIMMKNVLVSNCTNSCLAGGHVMVTERLIMANSSIMISESNITFIGDKYISGLIVIQSNIYVGKHSVLQFQKFNYTSLHLSQSTLILNNNSTMIFTQNHASTRTIVVFLQSNMSASNGSILSITENILTEGTLMFPKFNDISLNLSQSTLTLNNSSTMTFTQNNVSTTVMVIFLQSYMSVSNGSTLCISDNILTEGTLMLWYNGFINVNDGILLLEENKCQYSNLILAINTNISLENRSIFNFAHNTIHTDSSIFYHSEGWMSFSESSLVSSNNSVANKSAGLYYENSSIIISAANLLFEDNKCHHNSFLIFARNSNIIMEKLSLATFTHIKVYKTALILSIFGTNVSIYESSVVTTNNSLTDSSVGLYFWNSSLIRLSGAKLLFEQNKSQKNSILVVLINANIIMENKSFVNFVQNEIENSAIFGVWDSVWHLSLDSKLQLFCNKASGFFISTNASFSGTVKVVNNTAVFDEGVVNVVHSVLWFKGTLEVVGNRGEVSGGLSLANSNMYITGRALFSDNHAANGGAISFISSVMHISPNATVYFINNYAEHLGGAVYISKPRTSVFWIKFARTFSCSIRVLSDSSSDRCQIFSLIFNQNKAGTAGNAIYGGHTSACSQCGRNGEDICDDCSIPEGSDLFHYNGVNDSSDLSNFTSDPTRVCFCENDIPNCYKVLNNITVYPGENFNLSLAIIGYGLGTVPGLVIARGNSSREGSPEQSLFGSESEYSQEIRGITCQDVRYSIVSERDREYFALAVDEQSFFKSLQMAQSVVNFKITRREEDEYPTLLFSSLYEDFFYLPVFVKVNLLACPVGFQLVRGRCVCHKILLDNMIDTCFFSNGTGLILRPVPYWIGLPNDTNSPILIHLYCPCDYCQSKDINITAEYPDTQCQYQRSGVLCGSCRDGLSMILGSSECRNCSNIYLITIAIFIVCGMALIATLTQLNMTVSVGSLNGLILLANFLQANHTTFLPTNISDTSAYITFLSVFIAWLNLDLGISMCFFDGLTTYIKTWLQFVFPLYILALVGVMIITSNYSTRMTRLLGNNAVSVLATLILLSYTKILRIFITAFSFTTLTGSQDYHSVVWLADGNIKYFEPKHAILSLVTFLVLLFLGIPYTFTLIAAPWIQKSRFRWVSSLYNRFKPLFDAYMGPYKDRHRYWTGLLLLARVVLIVLFSSIANTNTVAGPQLNLLLLSLSSFVLVSLTAALKPYKKKLLNGLEIFFLIILFILSSSNLYISNIGTRTGVCAYMYIFLVGISFLVFLGICVHHISYRLRKIQTTRRSQQPNREEEVYYPPFWQRAKGRAKNDDKEREEIKMSTFEATNTISHGERRESLVKLLANLPE